MENSNKSVQSLLQLYTPVYALISALEVSKDYGDPEDLAVKTIKLLDSVRELSQRHGKNMDWVADAQYAVVAFVDESIGRSKWHGKEVWMRLPLGARMGLEPNSGVRFFQKLDGWMKSPQPPTEMLDVFYLCLGLGFQGQYFNQLDRLVNLKRELLHQLTKGTDSPRKLSLSACRPDDKIQIDPDTFPWLWYGSGAVGFLLLLFALFKFLSVKEINRLVEALH